ncbi:hypothetical protein PR003_g21041 [Phytophthora rubi]|uniref:Secreted protein n=1 Tax=Phytophthora rubi TaxID=129364 RepID=A0A6A4DF37_9STRA|nr:hypothetical protein PR002_g19982 [Phytophthora rubi]KAE8996944.1 hypothetical protein PR001_g19718 [Phytophthora rubi]KAE9307267.1 hypothetical protein PR003_g21041 [Phytophthora rubi]
MKYHFATAVIVNACCWSIVRAANLDEINLHFSFVLGALVANFKGSELCDLAPSQLVYDVRINLLQNE